MSELTIRHDHDGGTRLEGSSRGDGAYEVLAARGWTYRSWAGVHIRGTRDKFAYPAYLEEHAEALRAAGHTVTVEVDNTWRPAAVRWDERGERAENRQERHSGYAENAAGRSVAARDAHRAIGDSIPFGQPILVGHHSEGRSRRDVARMDSHRRREFAEADRAEHHADRAAGAARNEAAKHDPRAIMRKIEELETEVRRVQRAMAAHTGTGEWYEITGQRVARDEEEIAYLRAKLAAHADAGSFVAWSAANLAKGDRVLVSGRWCEVTRVNRKGVSVRNRWAAVYESDRSEPVTWGDIHGRRRDGEQINTPNGEPWSVETAERVARWKGLAAEARREAAYGERGDEQRHRAVLVRWAVRIAHGLDLDASDREVGAFDLPADTDVQVCRGRALVYLGLYDRLAAGENARDLSVAVAPYRWLTPGPARPAWRLPTGREPERRRAGPTGSASADTLPMVRAGDLVAGFYDTGMGRNLVRSFCGPVAAVSPVNDRREAGRFVTITLTDGSSRDLQTHMWLAVYPAGTWEEKPEQGKCPVCVYGEPAEHTCDEVQQHHHRVETRGRV